MRELPARGDGYQKGILKSLYHDIDGKHLKRGLDYRKLNAEHSGYSGGLVADMERNWEEAREMLEKATARYNEHDTGANFISDDGDRRHDKREVIYGVRVISADGLQVSYDRQRAAAEVRHWKEYLDWASAKEHVREYEKP